MLRLVMPNRLKRACWLAPIQLVCVSESFQYSFLIKTDQFCQATMPAMPTFSKLQMDDSSRKWLLSRLVSRTLDAKTILTMKVQRVKIKESVILRIEWEIQYQKRVRGVSRRIWINRLERVSAYFTANTIYSLM